MIQPIYLICGPPGSGKTWVCKQLADKFTYLPHDEHYRGFAKAIEKKAKESLKPIITECPFGERPLREELEKAGMKVVPYFVVEDPITVKSRYESREKKNIPKGFITRTTSIKKRAEEWMAPHGTSGEVLAMLKQI